MDPLGQLVDTIAAHDLPAALERLEAILGFCPPLKLPDGSKHAPELLSVPSQSQVDAVLALSRFLASSRGAHSDKLLPKVLDYFSAFVISSGKNGSHPSLSPQTATAFFTNILADLSNLVDCKREVQADVSAAVVFAVRELADGSLAPVDAKHADRGGALFMTWSFLAALGEECPDLLPKDADEVAILLFERYIHPPYRDTPAASTNQLNPDVALKTSTLTSNGNGAHAPDQEEEEESAVKGIVAKRRASYEHKLPAATRNGLHSTAHNGSLDNSAAASVPGAETEESAIALLLSQGEVEALQGRQRAFSVFAQLLRQRHGLTQTDASTTGQQRVAYMTGYSSEAEKQLKSIIPLLKIRKRDISEKQLPSRAEAAARFRAAEAAAVVQGLYSSTKELDGKVHKATVRDVASTMMDTAEACMQSAWRRVTACEELFDALVMGAAQAAVTQRGQALQLLLLRMKNLVLLACSQVGVWRIGEETGMLKSLLNACHVMARGGWENDRAVVESFLVSTTAYIRQQQNDKDSTPIAVEVRQNIATFVARLLVLLDKPAATLVILPSFLECLEEGAAAVPGSLRTQMLEAVAQVGGLGQPEAYREVVIMLARAYLENIATMTATDNFDETETAVPGAFLQLATDLKLPELRSDLRQRLLSLCSDVGLLVEAGSGRNGPLALGQLLPAVAAACSDVSPFAPMEGTVLKLFRNLWFYLVLYGLEPPLPGATPRPRSLAAMAAGNGGSVSNSVSTASLVAVTGPYRWPVAWSEAVQSIAINTPPLVVGTVKWLEDELELNALHNPGSQRGSASERAAAAQRAALASALANRVDTPAMSNIPGVKATYLLAVSALEILRMASGGGVIYEAGERPGHGGRSALACVFQYLESPAMVPGVNQCFTAMVHRAFDAGMTYIASSSFSTEEREAALEAHACFLINAEMHRLDSVRELADSLVSSLRNKFSQVLWNSRCLDSLLVLVADPPQPAPTADPQAVATQRSALLRRVREWVTYGLLLAPSTMQGLLQEKLRKFNTWSRQAQTSDLMALVSDIHLDPSQAAGWSSAPLGLVSAAAEAAAAAAGGAPSKGDQGTMEVLSTGMISANAKSVVAGEIAGMKKLFAGLGGFMPSPMLPGGIFGLEGRKQDGTALSPAEQEAQLDRLLMEKMVQVLQQFVVAAEARQPVDDAAFRDASLRAAALLLTDNLQSRQSQPEGFSRLLRLLCWCPGHIFTPAAIETGVFVWTWLLSAAPTLGATVLAELADSWLWTRNRGRGIFSSAGDDAGEMAVLRPQLSAGNPITAGHRDPLPGIVAHRIWLGFLLDRFEVARYSSKEQMLLIGRLLEGSLEDPSRLTTHPGATGTVFTLLLLGLLFCHSQLESATRSSPSTGVARISARVLRDRVQRAALAWFAVQPCSHDPRSDVVALGEAQAVGAFLKGLGADERLESQLTEITNALSGLESESSSPASRSSLMSRGMPDFSHPVWGSRGLDSTNNREKRRQLLVILCQHETDRLETWACPLKQELLPRLRPMQISTERWTDLVRTAWSVDPSIAICMVARFPTVAAIRTEVTSLVEAHLHQLVEVPEALPFFVTPAAVEKDLPSLHLLPYWAPCSIVRALDFLTPPFKGHPRVMAYVMRVLESYPPEKVTFFMPQLVQALRYDHGGLVRNYLMVAAHSSNLFAHILIWQLQGEEAPPEDERAAIEKKHGPLPLNQLWEIVPTVRQSIIDSFDAQALAAYHREFKFFDAVTSISGALKPLPKEERREGIKKELVSIQVEGDDIYLPTAPTKLVRDIIRDSGIPLQSAAKVPIMITFEVVNKDEEPAELKPQACIFKVGDDCRQDVLALQVIALLRDIYKAIGLDIYLFPYGVLPTGYERGIIEVVPNSRSRNQMGEITDGGLYEIFQQEYGLPGSPKFEQARHNFIVSSAGYAVASLLLQPKDRHNGNLLFDRDGHLVHIDFGFILETSPGGNMRFESADFKLSHEMTQLLDPSGVMKSETWYQFVSLCVKGYLAARQHWEGIVTVVQLMVDSGLPCFSRGEPIKNLRSRFHPELSEREAANFMIYTCTDAYNKWSTAGYDLIQYLQQGIEK